MYRPPAFSEDRLEVLQALVRAHPLGLLITASEGGLLANPLPFLLVERDGRPLLQAHLARANPQVEALRAASEALVVFQGPQAYISPSWYPTKRAHGKVVPTWNYVIVQAHGAPQIIDDPDWLASQIARVTDSQEGDRSEPWKVTDAPDDYIAQMKRAIIGLEIPVARFEGKWKTSQNQPADNQAGVVAGLAADGQDLMAAIVAARAAPDA